jgi:glycosyltransferase involved in cell wall biosynthesis
MPKKNISHLPLVSVTICAFNRKATISQTIDCVLNQKCNFNFEVIIGDDLSKDGTREICLDYEYKYPNIIRVIQHEENCGLGKNWALLVKESKGKYIASCDDDDYWHNPNKLQIQVDFLEKNIDYGMVHTEKDILVEPINKLIRNSNKNRYIPQGYLLREIFEGKVPICVSSSLIRKETLDKYVPLDLYIKYRFNIQDWPTWMLITKYVKIGYLNISTTTYRTGHIAISNINSVKKIEAKLEKDQFMYRLICDLFPNDLAYDENGYLTYKFGILLNFAFKKNDYYTARKYALKLKKLGINNFKIKATKNIFYFRLVSFLKKRKNHTIAN